VRLFVSRNGLDQMLSLTILSACIDNVMTNVHPMCMVWLAEPRKEREMATATDVMQFRLRNEEKERIKRGADLTGVPASKFVLRAALKEADHAEADQAYFALNGKQFDAFMAALNAEPTPNEALNKLLHTAAPWE
jgi:uncharacterized protein (DUF1778 family)